ncbi:hypothetical protein [Mucilaginibacter sp.]|uniref:hypothetical protein n=1 Tax=Mucilaginibacter sp. TaxID=1882438 RepID=UPI00261D0850|nr:hypothetical protein [Mucilaginibacter sp.]MDB5030369.1 hypothetical protein [Mucilaginibacter sp.]
MKKPLLLLIPFIFLAFASCKKLGVSSTADVSVEDAANIIGSSLASNSSGLTTTQSDVALSSQALFSNSSGCGITKIDSASRQSASAAETTYAYKEKFTNKLNCNTNNQPDNVTSSLTYAGYFNGPKVFITNSGSSNFTIAGLTPTATVYAINGTYKSTGNFKLKADTTKNGTVNIDIVIKNLIITKATATTPAGITGGTATAAISGSTPKKGAFSFAGALTFNGSSLAILTLNSTVYFVNLITGAVVKQQ